VREKCRAIKKREKKKKKRDKSEYGICEKEENGKSKIE